MESLPFLEDIFPDNLMYASIIRSPAAKGTITGIEVPPLPGQFILLTAKNIPGKNRLYDTKMPILAEEKLSYIGEPAALLIGPDKTKLENISALTIVKYEEETPLFKQGSPGEVSREIKTGNTQEAFEKTGRIVKGSFNTGIQDHWYAEPPGAVTWWKEISEKNEQTKQLLGHIDTLIDGRFVLEKRDIALNFKGSSNQRYIDMNETRKRGELVTVENL